MNPTPPAWHTATVWFCIAVTVVSIVYDVIAYKQGGVGATISRTLLNTGKENPVVVLAIGILLGHLFASQSGQ